MSRAHHSARWRGVRRKALERAAYRCERPDCRKALRLEVHHVTPLRAGGTDAPENLRVLCREHHVREHYAAPSAERVAWAALVQELAA